MPRLEPLRGHGKGSRTAMALVEALQRPESTIPKPRQNGSLATTWRPLSEIAISHYSTPHPPEPAKFRLEPSYATRTRSRTAILLCPLSTPLLNDLFLGPEIEDRPLETGYSQIWTILGLFTQK